jgi:hypothetical protein
LEALIERIIAHNYVVGKLSTETDEKEAIEIDEIKDGEKEKKTMK